MSLNKVSYGRIQEQAERGFDILTNGDARHGAANLKHTDYMQKPTLKWNRMNAGVAPGEHTTNNLGCNT